MDVNEARQTVLDLLRRKGKATNAEMLRALGGDRALLDEVREGLILDDLARDKAGVGLVALGTPAAPPPEPLAPLPAALEAALPRLPSLLALPLHHYRRDRQPVLRLWHACETVEFLLRLAVMLGLADLRRQRLLDGPVLRELASHIDEPTLGKWERMALAVARRLAAAPGALPGRLAELVGGVLAPLLDGPPGRERTATTALSALRNQLAHGGGLTERAAARLLEHWRGPFEEALARAAWLEEVALVVRLPGGELGALRGPEAAPAPFVPEDEGVAAALRCLYARGEEVAAVCGRDVLPLWPLTLYGLPSVPETDLGARPGLDRPVAQVYVRKGEVRLHFTPVGADEVLCQTEGDQTALEEFLRLFHLPGGDAAPGQPRLVKGFEPDIIRDARRLVGREAELDAVRHALAETRQGVLWLSGVAGIGKSYLVAKVAHELLERPPAGTLVLPYRFKIGDGRCTRDSFLHFAVERLGGWPGVVGDGAPAGGDAKPLEALRALLGRLRESHGVLLVLDGLDEIAEVDPGFARQVPLGLAALPRVAWLCAGRPERGLPEAFAAGEHCRVLFPDGLPGMTGRDIREMVLQKVGPLAARLLSQDRERPDSHLFDLDPACRAELERGAVPLPLQDRLCERGVVLDRPRVGRQAAGRWVVTDADAAAVYTVRAAAGRLQVHGDEVVNPFIERVERNAAGLPLYVRYVIGDILEGRRLRFDEGDPSLPPSLAAYHEELLGRCKVSPLHAIVTPVVTLLAVAREPLTVAQLAERLGDGSLVSDDPARAARQVRDGLAAVASVVRRAALPTADAGGAHPEEDGYTLFHHSFRQHLLGSPAMRDAVDPARGYLRKKCADVVSLDGSAFRPYVFRQGVGHLLERCAYAEAVNLLHHLTGRDDLEPHLPRGHLRQFAKAVSISLKEALAQGLADQARRVAPHQLEAILQGFYEIEPLYGGIRVLVEYHPAAWPEVLGRFLAAEDFVILYAIALALADACRDAAPADRPARLRAVLDLTEHDDIDHRELGFYALKIVYARRPDSIDRGRLARLARGDSYADRMILGELLLTLTIQGKDDGNPEPPDVRALVPERLFWEPVWPYNQLDVDDLTAAGFFVPGRPLPPDQPASIRRAFEALADTERRLRDVLRRPEVQETESLRRLFASFYALPTRMELIREAEADLGGLLDRAPALLEQAVAVLFAHPLWDVTENAASVLSSLAESRPPALVVIRRLVGHPFWRVRYAAVEAAFAVRYLDQHAAFTDAVRRCYRDDNSRVHGLCAENLMAWIVYSPPAEHAGLVGRFGAEIGHWVRHGADCWLLEHLYHLFRGLKAARPESGYDFDPLLAAGTSPLLRGDPPFYDLDRAAFLARIEERRREQLAARLR